MKGIKGIKEIIAMLGAAGLMSCGPSNMFTPNHTEHEADSIITLEVVVSDGIKGKYTGDDWEALEGGTVENEFGSSAYTQTLTFSEGSGVINDQDNDWDDELFYDQTKTTMRYNLAFTDGLRLSTNENHTAPRVPVNILGERYNIASVFFNPETSYISVLFDSQDNEGHYIELNDHNFRSSGFTTRDSMVDGKTLDHGLVTINAEVELDEEGNASILKINHIKYADQVKFNESVLVESCESMREHISHSRLLSNGFDIAYVDGSRHNPGVEGCLENISKYTLLIRSE